MEHPEDPMPTFRDWKDRTVYLVAEYKIPISATILAIALYLAFGQPETPDPPPEVMATFASVSLLAIPCFIGGKKITTWLIRLRMHNVQVCNGGDPPEYDSKRCPPGIWKNKKTVGAAPLDARDLDGWADYVVTDWEWLDDIGELRVRGSERTKLSPGEREASEAKVEAVYSHYVAVLNAFSKLKGRTQELMTLAHDDAMLQSIRVKDKTLAPSVSALDAIQEATKEEDDELPELGEEIEEVDMPDFDAPEQEPPEDLTDG